MASSLSIYHGGQGEFLLHLRARVQKNPWLAFGELPLPDERLVSDLMFNRLYYGDGTVDIGDPSDWDGEHADYHVMMHATRFDWLADLVAAFRQTGELRYAQKAIGLIESWFEGNDFSQAREPQRFRIRWGMDIVVSHRLVCMARTLFSLLETGLVNSALLLQLYEAVSHAACHLSPLMERHYQGNHSLIIGDHLIQLSILCEELPEAHAFREEYLEHWRTALRMQFLPDGNQAELSTTYQIVCYARLTEATDLCERAGVEVPADITAWRRRILETTAKHLLPNGQVAAFNDGYMSGWVDCIGMPMQSTRDIAARVGPLLGLDEATALSTNSKLGKFVPPFSHAMPWGGRYILRDGLDRDAMFLAFDAGPHGAGHQHEDALSFIFARYGKVFLTDIGSGAYDPSLPMRQYSLSTAAHSTVCVDGQDQVSNSFPETWIRSTPQESCHFFGEQIQFAAGEYSLGYGKDGLGWSEYSVLLKLRTRSVTAKTGTSMCAISAWFSLLTMSGF